MSRTTAQTALLSGPLTEFVSATVGENGHYKNVSEYIRGREAFEGLKAELTQAFAASPFKPLTAAEVIACNRRWKGGPPLQTAPSMGI